MQTSATPAPTRAQPLFVQLHVDRPQPSLPQDTCAPGGSDSECARQAMDAYPQPLHGPSLGGSSWFGEQVVRLGGAADGVISWLSPNKQSWPALHERWVKANEELSAAQVQLRNARANGPQLELSPGDVAQLKGTEQESFRRREVLAKQIADKVRAADGKPVGGDVALSVAGIWAWLDRNVIDPVSTIVGNLSPWSAPAEPAGGPEEANRI